MEWNNYCVTNAGVEVLKKAIGGKKVTITAAKSGTGAVAESKLKEQSALSGTVRNVTIANATSQSEGYRLTLRISNTGVKSSYTFKQLGVFAKIDNGSEILFAILQSENGETVPDESELYTYDVSLIIAISDTSNITVNVDKTSYVTEEELDAHITNKSNPHSVTKAQVGLGNVPNVSTNDQTPTYTIPTANAELTSGEKLGAALGKIARAVALLIAHIANKSNPHSVTKTQVGLGKVDNTADTDKPVSIATDNAIKSSVRNLQIGGRNIVTGTVELKTGAYKSAKWDNGQWRKTGDGTIITTSITDPPQVGITKGIRCTANDTKTQVGIAQDEVLLTSNTKYTLSCWVRGTPGAKVALQIYQNQQTPTDTSGATAFDITTEWQRVTFTPQKTPQITMKYSVAYIIVQPNNVENAYAEICGIKLERGDKATDWSPAPEDLATADHTHGTFTSSGNSAYSFNNIYTNFSKGDVPTSSIYAAYGFYDKNGITPKNRLGMVQNQIIPNGNVETQLVALKNEAEATYYAMICIGVKADGTVYTFAPTPPTSDNSTQIATTAFVKSNIKIYGLATSENSGLMSAADYAEFEKMRANYLTASNVYADNFMAEVGTTVNSTKYKRKVYRLNGTGGTSTTETNVELCDTTYGKASTTKDGLMSSQDKAKLDKLKTNNDTLEAEDLTNKTIDLNALNLSDAPGQIKYYVEKTVEGAANITNAPQTGTFMLTVRNIRWVSASNYITEQIFVYAATKKEYSRWCTNGTWSAWIEHNYTNTWRGIQNNLTSDSTTDSLSAAQGKALKTLVDGKASSGHTHSYAGSSSVGGAATSANKINTDAGSATQPVYFKDGIPKTTTYTLGKSVPASAVFTDTWKALVGSSTSAAGAAGYAPAPAKGTSNRYLRCDGAWVVPPNTVNTIVIKQGSALGQEIDISSRKQAYIVFYKITSSGGTLTSFIQPFVITDTTPASAVLHTTICAGSNLAVGYSLTTSGKITFEGTGGYSYKILLFD